MTRCACVCLHGYIIAGMSMCQHDIRIIIARHVPYIHDTVFP